MLLKAGVDISRLHRPVRRVLGTLERLYPDFIITSTYEGTHSPPSLHYAHDAIDVRPVTAAGKQVDPDVVRDALGPSFDVVPERTHIHIEYDPKG